MRLKIVADRHADGHVAYWPAGVEGVVRQGSRCDSQRFRHLAALCTLLVWTSAGTGSRPARAQIPVENGRATVIDFNTVGLPATGQLPNGVRAAVYPLARATGSFRTAGVATQHRGGNYLSATAPSGIYNLGSGDPATARDRAVGFVLGDDGARTGVLYLQFVNLTGRTLNRLNIENGVEGYRTGAGAGDGSRPSVVTLFSLDGETFVPTGSSFEWGVYSSTYGFYDAPSLESGESVNSFPALVSPGATFYFAFQFSVTGGDSARNMPVFAVDDVIVWPDGEPHNVMFSSRLEREFESTPVGRASTSKSFVVRWSSNLYGSGGPPFPSSAVDVAGPHARDFEVTHREFFPGSPQYVQYSVRFLPSALGSRTAHLTITSAGGTVSTDRIDLRGVGSASTDAEDDPGDAAAFLSAPYPNPARTTARVRLAGGQGASLALLNLLGQTVRSYPVGDSGPHTVDLDVSGLPAGVYVVRATADGHSVHRRLVVSR